MSEEDNILQPQNVTPSESGWTEPSMEDVPRPTYWPSVMAMGTVLLFWGISTMWAVSAAGLAVFVLGLGGWIWEMCHAN